MGGLASAQPGLFPRTLPVLLIFYCILSCLLSENVPLIFPQPAIGLLPFDYNSAKLKQRISALGYFSFY